MMGCCRSDSSSGSAVHGTGYHHRDRSCPRKMFSRSCFPGPRGGFVAKAARRKARALPSRVVMSRNRMPGLGSSAMLRIDHFSMSLIFALPARHIMMPQPLGKQIAVERIVPRLRKDRHAPVAALRDMMRNTGDDDAGEARHGKALPRGGNACSRCHVTVFPKSSPPPSRKPNPPAREGVDKSGLPYSAMGARSARIYPPPPKPQHRPRKGTSHVASTHLLPRSCKLSFQWL